MLHLLLSLSVMFSVPDYQLIDHGYCFELLQQKRDSLHVDSLGLLRVRLRVVEELNNNDCSFEGESIFVIKYFFGEPNVTIGWKKELATDEVAITYKYKLLTKQEGIKSSHGDKYLHINCSKDYRITEFAIYTIDE